MFSYRPGPTRLAFQVSSKKKSAPTRRENVVFSCNIIIIIGLVVCHRNSSTAPARRTRAAQVKPEWILLLL